MLIPELEALRKLCCGPVGCGTDTGSGRRCAGSDCMAWQVVAERYVDEEGKVYPSQLLDGSLELEELGTCGHAPEPVG